MQFAPAARPALVFGLLACGLAACGDDGGTSGPADAGSPLSSLLSGFSPTSGLPGDERAEASDAGTPGAVSPDATAATPGGGAGCEAFCGVLFECLPVGCPNFDRLTPLVRGEFADACVRDCAGVTDDQVAELRAYGCPAIAAELMKDPGLGEFCALEPASEADCARFCQQVRDCGSDLGDAVCRALCFYGEGVTCALERENPCDLEACKGYFPQE